MFHLIYQLIKPTIIAGKPIPLEVASPLHYCYNTLPYVLFSGHVCIIFFKLKHINFKNNVPIPLLDGPL